ncbi:helix-turn-helix domain-containing protein [Streptomyces sp. NPDC026672]|uniref:winged helix-turn-helix transcriptional regulator n=1 Tax=unclassified Streptomyces TaxID=2593676 RepID=UPI0033CECE47
MPTTTPRRSATEPALFRACPAVALLNNVSNRWVTQVIGALGMRGSLRYGELSREIPDVSQKMLTQTLRGLERDGMLTRTVTPTVPVRVDYELSALGLELYELLLQVKKWAEANVERVDRAREEYDSAQ